LDDGKDIVDGTDDDLRTEFWLIALTGRVKKAGLVSP
jgi:hypothetical protein